MDPIELTQRLGRWSSGRGPLYVLLATRLGTLIDDGELRPGAPLPPDRALASALAVGRSTVVNAYDRLTVEGRIVRRQGSGTRVAGPAGSEIRGTTDAPAFLHLLEPKDDVILLACAAPDAPPPELVQAYAETLPDLAALTGDIGYHPTGHPALRRAIAERYERRGVPTAPEQVLVTTGGQQALSLLARAFVSPGDVVVVEAPTYPGALEVFREEAAVLRPLPVGLDGLEAIVADHDVSLAYVIPTFHNPTGQVLPALRRQRLVSTAARSDVRVIEDEALVELGFPGEEPPPPLGASTDQVISIGSLSKVVWAGLRIGWVRAPSSVVTRLARLRVVHDLGGNVPAQLAAAHLLARLDPIRHRQAAQRQARCGHLRAELARRLPEWEVPTTVRGGQTLWIRLPRGDATSFAQTALRNGVAILPGRGLDAGGRSEEYLRVHFIAPPDQLSEAVRRLAAAWADYDPPATPSRSAPAMAV
ncbi:aminotransferase-like domain-containing protein [Actinopolymorpha pittospori]